MYDQDMIYECVFVKRLNRFVATVLLDGQEIDVHVKNTGRCKELLIPGSKGYLVKSENAKRKYAYDFIAIYKGDKLVNFDSQLPNEVVADFIMSGGLFPNVTQVKREVKYGNSRFDIYVEYTAADGSVKKNFVEVKGVTLFEADKASFPDAPTTRGAKHVEELMAAVEEGYGAYIFFLVQTDGVVSFEPNYEIDQKFANTLKTAKEHGVKVLCYNSNVNPDRVQVKSQVEVII